MHLESQFIRGDADPDRVEQFRAIQVDIWTEGQCKITALLAECEGSPLTFRPLVSLRIRETGADGAEVRLSGRNLRRACAGWTSL